MTWRSGWTVLVALLGLGGSGCGVTDVPSAGDAPLEDVADIVADAGASPQEKREDLQGLGFSDVQINGLLDGVRLGNQFGGTLESARDKIIAEAMSTLTPDEVQFYGDAIGPQFTDPIAQAIADLFAEEALDTAEELEAYLDDPVNEVPSVIDIDDLRTVFVDSDPDDVLDDL